MVSIIVVLIISSSEKKGEAKLPPEELNVLSVDGN